MRVSRARKRLEKVEVFARNGDGIGVEMTDSMQHQQRVLHGIGSKRGRKFMRGV